MSLRFTQDEVRKVVNVLAAVEDNFEDVVKNHVAAIPSVYYDQIDANTKELGSLQTFSAGILAGLEIANQRNLNKGIATTQEILDILKK